METRIARSHHPGAFRHQHANFFLGLAEATAATPVEETAKGFARWAVERDNLRTALAWSQGEGAGKEIALRLAVALREFWLLNGYWSEGRRWLVSALACTTAAEHTVTRAQALDAAGEMAVLQGDHSAARVLLEEAMMIARERGAQRRISGTLVTLSFLAQAQHDHALAFAQHSRL